MGVAEEEAADELGADPGLAVVAAPLLAFLPACSSRAALASG